MIYLQPAYETTIDYPMVWLPTAVEDLALSALSDYLVNNEWISNK